VNVILSIEVIETVYRPCWPSGVHVSYRVARHPWTVIVPEPYQSGDRPRLFFPPLPWRENEMAEYYRDQHHDGS
jgi:hypothetical protein